jgi:hypothetical protein
MQAKVVVTLPILKPFRFICRTNSAVLKEPPSFYFCLFITEERKVTDEKTQTNRQKLTKKIRLEFEEEETTTK